MEKLYNGIVLPDTWPPRDMDDMGMGEMPVPYMQERPDVVPIDLGRQLFVDDFLIEESWFEKRFHQATLMEQPVLAPETPMEWNRGVAPVAALARAGVPFGLGTDGPSSGNTLSMFDQMRLFAVSHKTANHDRSLFPAAQIVAAATRGGARALHAQKEFGMLKPGMRADFAVVRTDSLHTFPVYNPYSALVYSANASDVTMTVAGGVARVMDGKLTQLDERAVMEALREKLGHFMQAASQYKDMI